MTELNRSQVGLLSWRASRLIYLPVLLEHQARYLFPWRSKDLALVAGWGCKAKARAARRFASRKGLPFVSIEDGFLRSVRRDDEPLSVIIDDIGIYYDAANPSLLECLIARNLSPEQTVRARYLMAQWRKGRVSKYNYMREFEGELPEHYVLVVDQTYRDMSVQLGGADEASFGHMLRAALEENPECAVLVKSHPDVFTRKRRGYFDKLDTHDVRVHFIRHDCHPVRLIENCERIYTVTSQVGFEALMWGKPVRCFGMPFYAGWGLTEDELVRPNRRMNASLEQLVHATLIDYARYADPETHTRCEVEHLLDYMVFQRSMRERLPKKLHAVGISRWKRSILRKFTAGSEIQFHVSAGTVPVSADVIVWGSRSACDLSHAASVIRVEDGFLRSVGLGADFIRPVSWVMDDIGIYYDPSTSSRLEHIFCETTFDEPLLVRASTLRQNIVATGLSKYNLRGLEWSPPKENRSRIILVPGQVEDDASLRFATSGIRTNIELLRAVRARCMDAYIVYKPHPDVVAGLRRCGQDEHLASLYYDELVTQASLPQMLLNVDEVHTMTSLAGFEALIRGVAVTCYGQPFYAGWGLTTDLLVVSRRVKCLNLDQLIAGALILYPTYVSRCSYHYTTPERAVDQLRAWLGQEKAERALWRQAYSVCVRIFDGQFVKYRARIAPFMSRNRKVEMDVEGTR